LVHALLPADSGSSLSAIAFFALAMPLLSYDLGLTMRRDMHYHIRWSNTKLDWERFRTRQEAEQAARQLARPGETFALEQVHDATCVQCLKIWREWSATRKLRPKVAIGLTI
jgi:hypothetical protein